MRLILLIIFYFSFHITFGQTFKNDWTTFSAKNWTANFNFDTTSYFTKSTIGQLVFKNKIDKKLKLQYFVFEKNKIDTLFLRKKHEWEFVQSCGVLTDGKTNFTSFEFGQFYYLLKICHNCNTGLSTKCQVLSNKLSSFSKEKDKSLTK